MTDKTPPRYKRLAAVAFMRLFAPLPLWLAHGIGALLGLVAAYVPTRERRTARVNIDLCFADKDLAWRRRLLRRHYIEAGKAFTETCGIWMNPGDTYLNKVQRVVGHELLKDARESGEGILLLVPHLGNWEIAGNWCTSRFAVTGMYKPGKYPEVDAIMRKGREKYMGVTVPTDASGVRAMVKTLAQGGCLFILPDHAPDRSMGGEFSPFFGVPALTGSLTCKLASGRRPVHSIERAPRPRAKPGPMSRAVCVA